MKKEVLKIESMRKGILLKRIHMQIFEGETVHCIFDNLQEKKAFLEIVSGRDCADYGKVYYEEKRIPEDEVQRFFGEKIAVITKESNLIDAVTIAENIFLINPNVPENWLNHKKFNRETVELFEEFGVDVKSKTPVRRLSILEKIQVELIKAYLNGRKIMILTELCNLLSDKEWKSLIDLLKKLKKKGISCVIMEPLEDIDFNVSDTVAVIRRGRTVFLKETRDCDYTILHKALYSDDLKKRPKEMRSDVSAETGEYVMRMDEADSPYLKDVCMKAAKGEIVKVFCVDEKSYEELSAAIKRRAVSGNSAERKNRIGIVEGNPATATLFEDLTVMDNLQMMLSKKVRNIWLMPKYKRSIRKMLGDVIPEELFKKKLWELAPADIQKVLYCKWLIYSPELLVCIQPFAEGNIEAREMARSMIYMLKKRKIPILIVTSNSSEFNYCAGREVYIQHGEVIEKEGADRFLYEEMRSEL